MYPNRCTGLLILFVCAGANAQQPASVKAADESHEVTNSFCADKLQFPTYPPLARQARIQGTIVVTVSLGPDATVVKVEAESHLNNERAQALLLAPIENVLRKSSQFRKECGDKRVTLIYEFHLTGDPYDAQQQEMAFGYPNRFWITARPSPWTPSQ